MNSDETKNDYLNNPYQIDEEKLRNYGNINDNQNHNDNKNYNQTPEKNEPGNFQGYNNYHQMKEPTPNKSLQNMNMNSMNNQQMPTMPNNNMPPMAMSMPMPNNNMPQMNRNNMTPMNNHMPTMPNSMLPQMNNNIQNNLPNTFHHSINNLPGHIRNIPNYSNPNDFHIQNLKHNIITNNNQSYFVNKDGNHIRKEEYRRENFLKPLESSRYCKNQKNYNKIKYF